MKKKNAILSGCFGSVKTIENFCNITLKWLCSSQLSDSLTAGDRYQVSLAGNSPASREHQCDMATQGKCDFWASNEAVNHERGIACRNGNCLKSLKLFKRFATTLERRMQRNGRFP